MTSLKRLLTLRKYCMEGFKGVPESGPIILEENDSNLACICNTVGTNGAVSKCHV